MMLTLTIDSARRIYERYMQPDYKAIVRQWRRTEPNQLISFIAQLKLTPSSHDPTKETKSE